MKKIVFFIILITSLFIINNLVHSIYNLWQKQDLLTKAQRDVQREKMIGEKLKKQLKVVEDPEFVEEEARNKLLLSRPGEKIVIIPSVSPEPIRVNIQGAIDPNWKQWWKLFF